MDKIKKTNNYVFHYREFGKKNQETVLLLHGYANNAKMFNPLGRLLQKKYHAIALDFPMIHDQKKIEDLNTLVNYVTEFVNSLEFKKFTLVGFSMGGLIAVEYASQNIEQIKELILLNSFPQLLVNRAEFTLYKVIKPLLLKKKVCRFFSLIKKGVDHEVRDNFQSVFGTMFNVIDAKLINKFTDLPIKKTVVFFKDDKIIKQRRYRKLTKSLNCKIVVFPHGGHAVDQKSYWENVEKLWSEN